MFREREQHRFGHYIEGFVNPDGYIVIQAPQWANPLGTPTWGGKGTSVRLLPVLLLLALPTVILWYRGRRRFTPPNCTKCGYDLTGNESGVCPECGTEIEST